MLRKFATDIEPEAIEDIQKAIDYYNSCTPGLGKRFYNTIDKHFKFWQKIILHLQSVMMISVVCR